MTLHRIASLEEELRTLENENFNDQREAKQLQLRLQTQIHHLAKIKLNEPEDLSRNTTKQIRVSARSIRVCVCLMGVLGACAS